ncbi:universal stress protein [Alloscardovia omnicolens]|uniref:universal stress protein n=1 Tax=Alloscardovia omnicolens TaxID=419015 RepID=UPI00254A3929|nr:universal stress protein [Alloscardovia omnicolens]MDK8650144.1 universal stress protein [Alloscardovia omnicolens]
MTDITMHTPTPLGELAVGVDGTAESFAALEWAMQESVVTGQKVHAIYGWTHSWDLGDEPTSAEEWQRVRAIINADLRTWADQAAEGINFDQSLLKLTSVHSAGTTALLDIGSRAHQIVVGRRTMSIVARWFLGSMSENLVYQSSTPVTVVRAVDTSDSSRDQQKASVSEELLLGSNHHLPLVVAVDGSQPSLRALDFAVESARAEHRDIHVLYAWQTKTLSRYMEQGHAVPSVDEGQQVAQRVLATLVEQAEIPNEISVVQHAIHAAPAKALIDASHYSHRIIMGSRGLGKFDQHVLGSVSRKLLDCSWAPVTIVH